MAKVISHEIGRYSSKEEAWKVGDLFVGATYMSFGVCTAPCEGEWVVTVYTTRPKTTKKEFTDMLISFMAGELAGFDKWYA